MKIKDHWEKVYKEKKPTEVSWYQQTPDESLSFFKDLAISRDAAIIDIGGGDSVLVDYLIELGYHDITVLDISEAALNKAKERLGNKGEKVKWIAANVLDFKSDKTYDCWHDRAAFHFFTNAEEIETYTMLAKRYLKPNGKLIIGTFSEDGPEKCSGLEVKKYSELTITNILQQWFSKIKCIQTNHITPFKTVQNFIFCSFQKLSI